jgi:hypothetical protein
LAIPLITGPQMPSKSIKLASNRPEREPSPIRLPTQRLNSLPGGFSVGGIRT